VISPPSPTPLAPSQFAAHGRSRKGERLALLPFFSLVLARYPANDPFLSLESVAVPLTLIPTRLHTCNAPTMNTNTGVPKLISHPFLLLRLIAFSELSFPVSVLFLTR